MCYICTLFRKVVVINNKITINISYMQNYYNFLNNVWCSYSFFLSQIKG